MADDERWVSSGAPEGQIIEPKKPVQTALSRADIAFVAMDRRAKRARSAPSYIRIFGLGTAVGLFGAALEAGFDLNVFAAVAVMAAVVVAGGVIERYGPGAKTRDERAALVREQAVVNREARLRRIFGRAADAYFEVSRDGQVSFWESKAANLFGHQAETVLGFSVSEVLVAEHEREAFETYMSESWNLLDHFESRQFKTTMVRSTGCPISAEVTVWIDNSNNTPQLKFLIRDLTARHEFTQRVKEAQENEREALLRIQELEQAKSDFVSSVSHELRSPLTSTLGYLELLSEGDAGPLVDEQARMVEIASRNAKRLQRLIEDVLSLSRIESGAFKVRFRPVDVQSLIDNAVAASKTAASVRDVTLSSSVNDSLGMCAGDGEQLSRALDGIIGNAVKFTPPSGFVHVSAERVKNEICIVIADNGVGIDSEEQAKVFTRFFRAAAAVEQAHSGTGLGLTISKTIVEHHGGSITVDSVLGQGTTVTIVLPALAPELSELPEEEALMTSAGNVIEAAAASAAQLPSVEQPT